MTVFGYARVSSKDQNLDTQIDQLKRYGVEKIVSEKITGVAKQKPKLEDLLGNLKKGDTLVVARMDRLGRSTMQLLELVEELNERNIHLVILSPNIDTRDEIWGKLFLTIMSAVAEMERSLIKEKQRNGIAIAKEKGKYKGRVKKYHSKHAGMKHALDLYHSQNYTVKEITEITSVSRSALYRALNEENEKRELTQGGI
ncbi:recombinase family protein [Bacillus xiapuensis]|uniref:Recombinase family protein n=1 Tax=Bacillus xiapuensis TaxID=2014075 RepID=A0ABU6NGC5_9BACI|nr:recombinase family protein [Bacillus xiapuensis]